MFADMRDHGQCEIGPTRASLLGCWTPNIVDQGIMDERNFLTWKGQCLTCKEMILNGRGIFCANFLTNKEGFPLCKAAYHGACYRDYADNLFPVQRTLDDDEDGREEGFEVDDETKDMFMHGRDGDHVMGVCFECDVCSFRNVNERDVCWSSDKDLRTLRYIRRALLDVMWSRTTDTVKSTFNRMRRDCEEAEKELAVGHIFPKMGNPTAKDEDGMGLAIIMLHASLRKGVYANHLQFDTVRKTVSWAWHAWTAVMRGEDGAVFASDDKTMHACEAPTRSKWFQRFVMGVKKRMGVTRKQDEALTSEQLRALQELGDLLWERAEGVEEKRRIANVMAFVVIGFCASLRGEEVPLVSLKGLLSFWEETMVKGFLMLTLRGRFKGENNLKWHLVPVVDETSSGIRARRWVHRLVHLRLTEDRVEEGPLFVDGNGKRAKMRDFNSTFQEFVGLARDRSPEAFSSKVEIEDYNLRRSLRRGSTTQAHNNKTPVATIELVNRWRKREAARGAEPGLEMRQVYTQALTAVDATLEYSRNL